jgi:hypothetical protein
MEQQQQDDGAVRVLNGEKTGRRFFGEGRGGDSTWPEGRDVGVPVEPNPTAGTTSLATAAA